MNDRINLELKQAEILCLAGENGAGKTTLMKILCGV
ncbi:MAG: ATP-binding cassette domain-containing protein, partial [Treponema sp.]|nr:ATP-binding cassette domain-containing protein [Treponema sp.]